MAFDGSGNYTPPSPPTFPAVSGNVISSTYFNATINDIATALSNVICRDGQSTVTANISLNSHKLTSVTDPTNAQDAMTLNYFNSNTGTATTTAIAAAITAFKAATNNFTARNEFAYNPTGTITADLSTLFRGTSVEVSSTSDNGVSAATPGTNIPTLFNVSHFFGGSAINDGRNALGVHLHQTAATASSNTYKLFTAGYFFADTAYNEGGTGGSPKGTLYGLGSDVWLKVGATNWAGLIGMETNVCVETGANADKVVGVASLIWPGHRVAGTTVDAAYWATSASSTKHLNGIQFDDNGGYFPVETTGTLWKATGTGVTVSQGLDFSGITITNFMLRGNGTISTTSTGDATSVATGAIRSSGGLGVAKNLALGGLCIHTAKDIVVPLTGETVTIGAAKLVTIINPAGTLANLTIVLPTAAGDGDTRTVTFSQAITTLAWTGMTSGFPTTMARNASFSAVWDSRSSTWFVG